MRNVCLTVLLSGLTVACNHPRPTAQLAPTCTTADKALLEDLQRTMHDSTRIADLERARADTAMIAELSRMLADTARMADLRRLAVDSAWGAQHQPQVDALLAELTRYDSCRR